MRLVLVDDTWLAREGLARLLAAHGHTVVGVAGHPDEVPMLVQRTAPELVILDIRMPPAFTDEGLHMAGTLRQRHADLPLLLLSQYSEPAYVNTLLELTGSRHCGYLLKDNLLDAAQLDTTLDRLAAGELVIDPAVIRPLLGGDPDPLTALTPRERDVLALMAEGLTDRGIAERLFVSLNTVGTHTQRVLRKLDIPSGVNDNRRVLAVLTYLEQTPPVR
jgi:DNA-binding NarL/FixJ family response regulator